MNSSGTDFKAGVASVRVAVLVAGLVAVALFGREAWAGVQPLIVLHSGDTQGEYDPCGCPGNPTGGFARRVTAVKQARQEGYPVLILDAGNALLQTSLTRSEVGEATRRRAELMAELLKEVGTQAIAVGASDLWAVGTDGLERLAASTGLKWLSANVKGRDGAQPFASSLEVTAGAVRVGIVGLTQPLNALSEREGITFVDPVVAAREAVKPLVGKVDLLIALTNLSYEMLEAVRAAVPEFDLILAGAPGEAVSRVSTAGPPWRVHSHLQGRSISRIDLRLSPGSGQALTRSAQLERRARALQGARDSLESLRALIIEQEGAPNPERFKSEGRLLRRKIDALSVDPYLGQDDARVFGYRRVPLVEAIAEDEAILKRISRYENSETERGGG